MRTEAARKHVPAFTGEFGLKLHYWVPQVHTLCLREPTVVEIEPGEEALFPAAHEWRVVEGPMNHAKRGGTGRPPDLGVEPTRFVPEPHHVYEHVDDDGGRERRSAEVVVCPRQMSYGTQKNWWGWHELVEKLRDERLDVAAAGAPGSSPRRIACYAAWYATRPLDMSTQLMRSARLVIATDAGLAHLAVLCGTPLLVVTYRGLVAPGPVIDSSGRKARDSYWRAGYDPAERVNRFEDANHTGSPIEYVDGWEDPTAVADHARRMLS